jgi:hypothetical protein
MSTADTRGTFKKKEKKEKEGMSVGRSVAFRLIFFCPWFLSLFFRGPLAYILRQGRQKNKTEKQRTCICDLCQLAKNIEIFLPRFCRFSKQMRKKIHVEGSMPKIILFGGGGDLRSFFSSFSEFQKPCVGPVHYFLQKSSLRSDRRKSPEV